MVRSFCYTILGLSCRISLSFIVNFYIYFGLDDYITGDIMLGLSSDSNREHDLIYVI